MPSAHRISLRPPPPLPPSPPQEQFQGEREGLLDDYRILTQQIKLKNLIIACFIPPDYQDKIMQHCHWQDYEGAWNIDFLPYAGRSWVLPWAAIYLPVLPRALPCLRQGIPHRLCLGRCMIIG